MTVNIIRQPSAIVTARTCAYLAHLIEHDAIERRRDKILLHADLEEDLTKLELVGAEYVNQRGPAIPAAVPPLAITPTAARQWITSRTAADQLQITPRRVTALLMAGQLLGAKQPNGQWLIDLASVIARKESSR